jgi:hypothetical protein
MILVHWFAIFMSALLSVKYLRKYHIHTHRNLYFIHANIGTCSTLSSRGSLMKFVSYLVLLV